MNGDQDEWVRVDEARVIFDALKGPKTLQLFAGVGHVSCLRRRPEEWKTVVERFLRDHVTVVPAAAAVRTTAKRSM